MLAGISLVDYLDKSVLVSKYFSSTGEWEAVNESISPSYILFGFRGGALLDFSITRNISISAGVFYQYYPVYNAVKNIDWESFEHATSGTYSFTDAINLSGIMASAGIGFHF